MIEAKFLQIRCDTIDRFIRIYDGTRYLTLAMKNMILFTPELDIL